MSTAESNGRPDWSGLRVATMEDEPDDAVVRTTWTPVDLTAAVAGDDLPPPDILQRTDGACLLYSGKTHWFQGEPESGKTWVAVAAASQVLRAGGRVLWIDFEDDERTVVARLKGLGVAVGVILDRFVYVRPDEPLGDRRERVSPAEADFAALVGGEPYALAVIDGVTEAMLTEGLNLMDNADIAAFMRRLPRRLADAGAAVVGLDHVSKDNGGRGRWAIGGQHKLAGLSGVAYRFDVVRPFARPCGAEPGRGVLTVSISKDRVGHVRAQAVGDVIATCELTSWPDGAVEVVLKPFTTAGTIDRRLCAEIADYLRAYDGASTRAIGESVAGKTTAVLATLRGMVESGWVAVVRAGQSHQHSLTVAGGNEFPEDEDA